MRKMIVPNHRRGSMIDAMEKKRRRKHSASGMTNDEYGMGI